MDGQDAASTPQGKRPRAPNFTNSEKEFFVGELMPVYKDYIECKKTDAMTTKEKEAKWAELAGAFNAGSAIHYRSIKSLQALWDNLKRAARAAKARDKLGMSQTGTWNFDFLPRSGCWSGYGSHCLIHFIHFIHFRWWDIRE